MDHERRNFHRFQIRLPLVFSWQGVLFESFSVDASEGGLQLTTDVDLGEGNDVVLHFSRYDENSLLKAHGMVMWSRAIPNNSEQCSCGIQFAAIHPEAIGYLRRFFSSKQQRAKFEHLRKQAHYDPSKIIAE